MPANRVRRSNAAITLAQLLRKLQIRDRVANFENFSDQQQLGASTKAGNPLNSLLLVRKDNSVNYLLRHAEHDFLAKELLRIV